MITVRQDCNILIIFITNLCAAAAAYKMFKFVFGVHLISSSIFLCQKHCGMGLVVNDEDFCCDRFIGAKFKLALIGWLFLRVCNVLGRAVCREPKDLQAVFFSHFHAVD